MSYRHSICVLCLTFLFLQSGVFNCGPQTVQGSKKKLNSQMKIAETDHSCLLLSPPPIRAAHYLISAFRLVYCANWHIRLGMISRALSRSSRFLSSSPAPTKPGCPVLNKLPTLPVSVTARCLYRPIDPWARVNIYDMSREVLCALLLD